MSTFRLALSEFRRLTAGRLPTLALVALVLLPTLYGALYLYANKNPYDGLSDVPAALVVADRGAEVDGKEVVYGDQVADDLVAGRTFGWQRFDQAGAEEAARGVTSGRYDFAITLPEDFSASLASPAAALENTGTSPAAATAPRQALVVLSTNDANNYLVRTIAGTVAEKVRASIAERMGEEAANRFLLGFSTIWTNVKQAADGSAALVDGATRVDEGASRLAAGADELLAGQRKLAAGAAGLSAGAARVDTGAASLAGGADQLTAGAGELRSGLTTLEDRTSSLPTQTRQLADGAARVAEGNTRVARAADAAADVVRQMTARAGELSATGRSVLTQAGLTPDQVNQVLAQLESARAPLERAGAAVTSTSAQLDQLAAGSQQVADGAERLADATPALTQGISRAADGADQLGSGAARLSGAADRLAAGTGQLSDGAEQLASGERRAVEGTQGLARGADQLADGSGKLVSGTTQLNQGLSEGLGQIPSPDEGTRQAAAGVLADPVAVRNVAEATAGSYGAGLAPFFLSLGTWIGGYVIFLLVRPLSRRALAAGQPSWRVALAGWMTPALVGAAQVGVLVSVVALALRIQPVHPWATFAFLLLASATFIAIVHALNAWLGTVGQFLGLVLMVLQLVSAGGTFPWQTIPGPLKAVHFLLPMSHSVDGLRLLMYGGDLSLLGSDVRMLVAYLAGALLLSVAAAWRQRVWTGRTLLPAISL